MSAPFPAVSIAEAHAILTAPGQRFEMEEARIRGVPTRVWKHAPATLRTLFEGVSAYATRTCFVLEEERVTYDAFARAVRRLAQALRAAGLKKGERVALIARNLPEWPVVMFAASLCGAIVTPVNAWGKGPELLHAVTDSGAAFVVADAERLALLAPLLSSAPAVRAVYALRTPVDALPPLSSVASVAHLEELIGPPGVWGALPESALPDVAIAPDDDAMIFYTSGTTGKPKGAVVTHRNACSNTLTTAAARARAFVRRGEPVPPAPTPATPQRALLLTTPLFHVMGCMPLLVAGLYQGVKVVMMRKWDAGTALALIERERIAQVGSVPAIAWQLVEHPAVASHDLGSLDSVSYGGAPAAPELLKRIRALFPKVQASNGWGMTEVTSSFASNGAEDYLLRPGSCGVPAPTNDWKIMSEDGTRELPTGEAGELWVRGPQVMRGYWNDPDATRAVLMEGGWLRTGDVARIDHEGFATIVDRAKDMLIRGGENIYCVEVENALVEHPAVRDAAVVGLAHPRLGEEPAAVVQLREGEAVDEAALQAFAGARLARFKVPVRILFTSEPLPRNAAGKLLKQPLRTLFEA